MSELRIEVGIPMPTACNRKGGIADTIRRMKPGDSVLRETRTLAMSVYVCGRRIMPDATWSIRKVEDGVRVWRTA